MKKLVLSLIVITVVASFSFNALALPKNGLMLYFTFDQGTVNGDKVQDLSGQGNDGTINGNGKVVNGALEFDGAGVYVGSPALQIRTAGNQEFAAIGWFKTDQSNNGPLWMWGDNAKPSSSSDAEAPVGWRSSSKNFAAGFYINGHTYAEAKEAYTDNKWHFVAQVGDGDTGFLYVDGEQIASAAAGYVYPSNHYFIIGARLKNSGSDIDDVEYFKGFIDQIAVFSIAMSEQDIKKIAAEGAAVFPTGKLTTTWATIKNQ